MILHQSKLDFLQNRHQRDISKQQCCRTALLQIRKESLKEMVRLHPPMSLLTSGMSVEHSRALFSQRPTHAESDDCYQGFKGTRVLHQQLSYSRQTIILNVEVAEEWVDTSCARVLQRERVLPLYSLVHV